MKKNKSFIFVSLILCLVLTASFNVFASSQTTTGTTNSSESKIVVSPQAISPNPPYAGYVGWVSCTADPGTYVNVRSGPGIGYSSVGYLNGGEWAYVLETRSDGWARLRNPNTNETWGWCSTTYLYMVE